MSDDPIDDKESEFDEAMYATNEDGFSESDLTVVTQCIPIEVANKIMQPDLHFVLASFNFNTWNPNNLHWEAPSSMVFEINGRVYLYAARIANHRRHGPFGHGRPYNWGVSYRFLDGDQAELYWGWLGLGIRGYNQTRNDASAAKVDDFLKNDWRKIRWIAVTRHINRT
jgi:hypothetical protein